MNIGLPDFYFCHGASQDDICIPRCPSLAAIRNAVSEHTEVPVFMIVSDRRTTEITYARKLCYYLARELTLHSFPAIGLSMRRDHSTVLAGAKSLARRMKTDITVSRDISAIKKKLGVL